MKEIKPGYKETPIGILPRDWEVKKLDEVTSRGSGHTPNKKNEEYYNGDIKWISLSDSFRLDKGLIYDTNMNITELGIKNSSAVLHPKGTVLMSRDAGVGKSAIMNEAMCVSQHFITWTCEKQVYNNWFLYYLLQYNKKEFERIAVGSTIKTIGLPYFKSYLVPVPKIEEQEKIAQILMTWDEAIEKQEELIEQEKEFKKGMMQKIFNLELRFKNENGNDYPEWDEKKLEDLFEYQNGGSFEAFISENGDYDLITLNSIDIKGNLKTKHKKISITDNSLKKNDLIMVLSDVAHGNFLGLTAIIPEDNRYVLNQRMGALKKKDIINVFFTRYWINYNQSYFKLHGQGSSQLNLSKGDILNFKLILPILQEQEKIADFLSTIDEKIEILEKKLEELKEQKKGLMQKLLTGEVRV